MRPPDAAPLDKRKKPNRHSHANRSSHTVLLSILTMMPRRLRNATLVQQPHGEIPPAIPTERMGHTSLSADTKSAEIRRSPRLDPQPLQPGRHTHQPPEFQGSTHRCAGRMASTLRGLNKAGSGRFLRLFWFYLTAPPMPHAGPVPIATTSSQCGEHRI